MASSTPVQMQTPTAMSMSIQENKIESNQDFAFLINIIKSLEKTIETLNKRLEAYESLSQFQIQSDDLKKKEQHPKTVHEKEKMYPSLNCTMHINVTINFLLLL